MDYSNAWHFQVQRLRSPRSGRQLCGMVAFNGGHRQSSQYAIHFGPHFKTVTAREPTSRGYRRCVASLAGRNDNGGAFVALEDADFIRRHGNPAQLTKPRISEPPTRLCPEQCSSVSDRPQPSYLRIFLCSARWATPSHCLKRPPRLPILFTSYRCCCRQARSTRSVCIRHCEPKLLRNSPRTLRLDFLAARFSTPQAIVLKSALRLQ